MKFTTKLVAQMGEEAKTMMYCDSDSEETGDPSPKRLVNTQKLLFLNLSNEPPSSQTGQKQIRILPVII